MPKPEAAAKINFSKEPIYHYWPKLGVWYESNQSGWWAADPKGNWLGWYLPGQLQPVPVHSQSREVQLKLRGQPSQTPRLLGGKWPFVNGSEGSGLRRRYPGYTRPSLIYRTPQDCQWSFGVPRLWASFDRPHRQLRIVSAAFVPNASVWQRHPNIQAWLADWLDWYAHYLLHDSADDAKIPALLKLLEVGGSNLSTRFRQAARQHLAAELDMSTRQPDTVVVDDLKLQSAVAAKRAWWGAHSQWLLEVLEGLAGAPTTKIRLFSPAARLLIDQLRSDNRLRLRLDLAWFDNFLPANPAFASQLTAAEAKTKLVRVLDLITQHHHSLGIDQAPIPEASQIAIKSYGRPTDSITSLNQYIQATRLGI